MLKDLLSINLKWLFVSMFPSGNKSKKSVSKPKKVIKRIFIGLLAIYVIGVLLISTGFFFTSIASSFGSGELRWFYFAFVALTVFMFTFIGSVFTAQNLLFNAKDNNLLLSMPIPVILIFISRLLVLFLLNMIYALMISVPACAVFFMLYGLSVKLLLIFFTVITATVLLSTAATCFFGWIIALVLSRIRKKNIFQTVFSLLLFGVYIVFATNIQGNINILISNGETIAAAIKKVMPFFYLGGIACAESNIAALFATVIIAGVVMCFAYLLIAKTFLVITTTQKGSRKKEYTAKELKPSGVKIALFKKELARFFSLPMYILNCAMGGIMAILIAVFLTVKSETILSAFLNVAGEELGRIFPVIIAVVFAFCSGMCNSASASISLEGSQIDTLKAMPVNALDFYFAKFASNFVIGFIPISISAIIASVGLKFKFVAAASLFVSVIAFLALSSLINLLCNTLMPKFRWNSETVIIKQSASVGIAMLVTIAVCATIYAPYFAVSESVAPENYIWITAAVSLLGCAIIAAYFKTKGIEKFNNMHL